MCKNEKMLVFVKKNISFKTENQLIFRKFTAIIHFLFYKIYGIFGHHNNCVSMPPSRDLL